MKKACLTFLLPFLVIFISCNSDDDPLFDCTTVEMELSYEVLKAECSYPGEITISVTGGASPYTYSLDGVNFQSDNSFQVSASTYSVFVVDMNGCEARGNVLVPAAANAISLEIDEYTPTGCDSSDGSITLVASGGSGDYQYLMDDGTFQSLNVFTGLAPGGYHFTVKDQDGCTALIGFEMPSGVSLAQDVMPLINRSCAVKGCHLDTESPFFTSMNAVRNNAEDIVINITNGNMPPEDTSEPKLSDEEIALISCWFTDGFPNN